MRVGQDLRARPRYAGRAGGANPYLDPDRNRTPTPSPSKALRARGDVFSPYCVWVAPPSLDSLRARLRGRGTEDNEQIEARIARATQEIEFSLTARCFDKIILNEEGGLEAAYAELRAALDGLA